MAEQRITTKPMVNTLLDEDYIFINHDGALRQVRKSDADLASAEGLAAEATARAQFEEDLTEANEEFVETVDERMNAAESIVYGAFIVKSASGDIASFSDGADDVPMKSLKVAITPKQGGSGDPSPDNVRPISGWTDADVIVAGKNIVPTSFNSNLAMYGDGQHRTTQTGTLTASLIIKVSPNASYTISGTYQSADGIARVGVFDEYPVVGSVSTQYYYSGSTMTINTGANDKYLLVWLTGSTATAISGMQIELGTTATNYEPYAGHTTTVPLGSTVYGGSVDVTTGELTITQVAVDAGALSWTTRYTGSTKKTIAASVGASNKYNPQSQLDFVGACGVYITHVAGASILNNPDDRATGFYTYRGSNDTPEDSLYMVLPVNDTPSGLVVFNKYTPTTVQLTPAEVRTLLGQNNVWSNAGLVEVEYRADPTLAYAELQALILENL